MEKKILLSEARVRASLITVPEGYEVHCKELLCCEDCNMGNVFFKKGQIYPLWIAYALKEENRRYVVHGLTIKEQSFVFTTDCAFGSLERVLNLPDLKTIIFNGENYQLLNLPMQGNCWIPEWLLQEKKLREHLDANLSKRSYVLLPGILCYEGKSIIAWLVQRGTSGKMVKRIAYIDFSHPEVPMPIIESKINYFVPFSGINSHVGNSCCWYDGGKLHFENYF